MLSLFKNENQSQFFPLASENSEKTIPHRSYHFWAGNKSYKVDDVIFNVFMQCRTNKKQKIKWTAIVFFSPIFNFSIFINIVYIFIFLCTDFNWKKLLYISYNIQINVFKLLVRTLFHFKIMYKSIVITHEQLVTMRLLFHENPIYN